MASLGKVFEEAALERFATDEKWLEGAAKSTFGEQAINSLLSWLASPPKSWVMHTQTVRFKLTEGERFPDLSSCLGQFTLVEQLVPFLPGDFHLHTLCWLLLRTKSTRRREIKLTPLSRPGRFINLLKFVLHGHVLRCWLRTRSPAQVLPCVGLIYMASKKSAEFLRGWSYSAKSKQLSSVRIRTP